MPENSINHFTICVAGITVRVNVRHFQTYWMCWNYLCEKKPDFEVTITDEDLEEERLLALEPLSGHPEGHLESMAVYRKIVEKATCYNAFLMHGAAIAVNGKGYLFSGKSGVGKTTHIQKWLTRDPDTVVINGDKPLIRFLNDIFYVCGTPWSGKEYLNTNSMVPLKSIAFMTRSEDVSVTEIGFLQALRFLLNQVYMHKDADNMQKTLNLLGKMAESVRFYDFRSNNLKEDCYQIVYDAITK